eukprot:symbB.v1.2.021656.t1/scaffold1879.1/size97386/5
MQLRLESHGMPCQHSQWEITGNLWAWSSCEENMRNSDNFETQTASGLCVLLLRFADLDQSFTQSVVAPCFICRSDRQSVIFSHGRAGRIGLEAESSDFARQAYGSCS